MFFLKSLYVIPSAWKTIVYTFYLLLVCIGLNIYDAGGRKFGLQASMVGNKENYIRDFQRFMRTGEAKHIDITSNNEDSYNIPFYEKKFSSQPDIN